LLSHKFSDAPDAEEDQGSRRLREGDRCLLEAPGGRFPKRTSRPYSGNSRCRVLREQQGILQNSRLYDLCVKIVVYDAKGFKSQESLYKLPGRSSGFPPEIQKKKY